MPGADGALPIPVEVDGQRLRMTLDTGAAATSLTGRAAARGGVTGRKSMPGLPGAAAGSAPMLMPTRTVKVWW